MKTMERQGKSMKVYDFEVVKAYIEANKNNINRVYLGIYEDWFWTAETIFENGTYTKELNNDTKIMGLKGSLWATPVMKISFKNGEEKHLIVTK